MISGKVFKYYPFLIPLVLWSFFFLLLQSQWYLNNPTALSMAVTVDFLLTVPLCYFLVIRNKDIPKFTVFTVFVIGLLLASFWLPEKDQGYLNSFKSYVLPFIELAIIGFLVYKTNQTVKAFKANKNQQDFYTTLLNTTRGIFPKVVATVVTAEISMLYYGIFHWKRTKLEKHQFSYHKKNALLSIIGGLTLVIVGETIGLHAWLVAWSPIVGWIVTVLSAYTALQFFALAKSIPRRPISIDENQQQLHLTYGFFNDSLIDMESIEKIELNNSDLPKDKSVVHYSPLGSIGEHNVIVHFKKEQVFSGMYGIKKRAKAIALFVDEREKFAEMLESNMLIRS